MNELQMLQRVSTETVPKLKEVVSRFSRVFPDFKLKPSVLERTPNADTFVAQRLETSYAGDKIVQEYIDTSSRSITDRLATQGSRNKASNTFEVRHELQEMNRSGNVTAELHDNGNGYAKALEHEYDSLGRNVQTKEYSIYPDNGGVEVVRKFDTDGKTIFEDIIPDANSSIARRTKVVNPDGSKEETVYQLRKYADSTKELSKLETKIETNAAGNTIKATRTVDGKVESLVEVDPETKEIVRLKLIEQTGLSYKGGHTLDAEFTPKGICKSVKVSTPNELVYEVKFDGREPIEMNGTIVDQIRENLGHDRMIEQLKDIGTPFIENNRAIHWEPMKRLRQCYWDTSILQNVPKFY